MGLHTFQCPELTRPHSPHIKDVPGKEDYWVLVEDTGRMKLGTTDTGTNI